VFTDWAQAKQWVQLGCKLCPASEQEFSVHSPHVKHIYRQWKLVTATGTPFHIAWRSRLSQSCGYTSANLGGSVRKVQQKERSWYFGWV